MLEFVTIGINYKKTDAATRGLFAIDNHKYSLLVNEARSKGVEGIFILSTCNRTEIYATTYHSELILSLFAKYTNTEVSNLLKYCYIKHKEDAIQHLFEVGAGLDSQILGDYEIIGQLKNSFHIAKKLQTTNAFLERLFNTVLQATKVIKQQTKLSSGTISVSFALVQSILHEVTNAKDKKTLLIGTGKIGTITCKNINDYIQPADFTVMNRSNEKANELSNLLNIQYQPFESLHSEINKADIIIVSTQSDEFLIKKNMIDTSKSRYFYDLSIPNNVDPSIGKHKNQHLKNVDDLSKINDEALSIRKAEIPKALHIIQQYKNEFKEWHQLRKYAPVLNSLKQSLFELQLNSNSVSSPNTIKKIINKVATDIRKRKEPTCFYMQTVQEFISKN